MTALPPAVLQLIAAIQFEGTVCIRASLTVRDFLRRLGYAADVRSVALQVTATVDELHLHTIGIGLNKLWGDPYRGRDWDGHLVVVTPGWLIDPTFYATRREAWSWVPSVALVRRRTLDRSIGIETEHRLLPAVAMAEKMQETPQGLYRWRAIWAATSSNQKWRHAPEALPQPRRRDIEAMLATYAELVAA